MLRFRIHIVNQKDSYIKNETKTNRMKLSFSQDQKESQGLVQAACLPDADRWTNVMVLCKLSFSLPFSNGSGERMFSSLKVVKSDWRTRLHHDILTDLLEIRVERPPLETFHPNKQWKPGGKTATLHADPIRVLASSTLHEKPPRQVQTHPLLPIKRKKLNCSILHSLNGMPSLMTPTQVRVKPLTTKLYHHDIRYCFSVNVSRKQLYICCTYVFVGTSVHVHVHVYETNILMSKLIVH